MEMISGHLYAAIAGKGSSEQAHSKESSCASPNTTPTRVCGWSVVLILWLELGWGLASGFGLVKAWVMVSIPTPASLSYLAYVLPFWVDLFKRPQEIHLHKSQNYFSRNYEQRSILLQSQIFSNKYS